MSCVLISYARSVDILIDHVKEMHGKQVVYAFRSEALVLYGEVLDLKI